MATRILIADDHHLLRAGLCALLRSHQGFEVVGEAGDGRQAVDLARELDPDLLLLDISMPVMDGIAATREARRVLPRVKILILTIHEDEALLREALEAGASGYVVKRAAESELINAILAAMRGELYIHPSMTRALVEPPAHELGHRRLGDVEQLTPREVEVLGLIAEGFTNAQVAEQLGLSVRTIESHRANIMGKLGIGTRAELVHYALREGLLTKS
jgi:two-component system response regulator NreC